jgi:hypothetical protein
MYCPICFNDTLKVASSGVVKVTFNGKAKATSQFFYNLKQDKPQELLKKVRAVISEYFEWYATFQNKDPLNKIEMTSCDFLCSTGCKLNVTHRLNIIDLIISKQDIIDMLETEATRFNIPLKLKF